jgi:hypothetical protein
MTISPHLMIRIARLPDFRAWYRACLAKNWPQGQEVKEVKEVNEVKEAKENAAARMSISEAPNQDSQRVKISA